MSSEFLNNIAVILVATIVGLIGYYGKTKKQSEARFHFDRPAVDRLLSTIEFQSKAQDRMAAALEALADKRASEMDDKLDVLVRLLASSPPAKL